MAKAKAAFPSDTIALKISTGGNSAGNGGDGVNTGDITSKPSIDFNPYNKADADVHVKTGDQVHQKAYWDADGANAKAEKYSKAEGGKAVSNGDQKSDSGGHNKSDVDANTKAYQENYLKVDMSQNVWAGIGGNGGDHNKAEGGDVYVKVLNDSLNSHEAYYIEDSGMLAHG
jgi:hypothetical protein